MKTICITIIIYINLMTNAGYILNKSLNNKFLRFNSKFTEDIMPSYKKFIQASPEEDSSIYDDYINEDQSDSLMDDHSGCLLGTIDIGRRVCIHCRQYHLMLKHSACFYEQFIQNCPFTWHMFCVWYSPDDMIPNGRKKVIVTKSSHAKQMRKITY